MTYDSINPNHYRGNRKFEPIEVIEDWGLNYRLGNAVKYISRNGRKPGEDPREGLKKAIWYLQREIESLEPDNIPHAVTYEDVLNDHAACALEEEQYDAEQTLDHQYDLWMDRLADIAVEEASEIDWLDFWDPSLGPVELTEEEIHSILSRKDLEQFHEDEIVSTFERRGIIFGVKKDGSSCILNDLGRCEQ